jgi:hypothetical protein
MLFQTRHLNIPEVQTQLSARIYTNTIYWARANDNIFVCELVKVIHEFLVSARYRIGHLIL